MTRPDWDGKPLLPFTFTQIMAGLIGSVVVVIWLGDLSWWWLAGFPVALGVGAIHGIWSRASGG